MWVLIPPVPGRCIIVSILNSQKCKFSALNVMATRDQRHTNVSKLTALLAGLDVGPPNGAA